MEKDCSGKNKLATFLDRTYLPHLSFIYVTKIKLTTLTVNLNVVITRLQITHSYDLAYGVGVKKTWAPEILDVAR